MTGHDIIEDTTDETEEVEDVLDIPFVGPATAETLEDAPFDPLKIVDKEVSYEMLIDAGVNPGVASRLRREHSLSWSFEGGTGEDLATRSDKVKGLQDDERAWIAASTDDWETTDTGSTTNGRNAAEAAEAAWRDRSRPDPLTDIPAIDEEMADVLAEGGITSVRSLATADPEHVADTLQLDQAKIEEWCSVARERTSQL